MKISNHLIRAASYAIPRHNNDSRNFWLGCIGIRADGAMIISRNGEIRHGINLVKFRSNPNSHAEIRAAKKLGRGGILFVSRVSRENHSLAMARPCGMCRNILRAFEVQKVYYTIDDDHYGVWMVKDDYDKIYNSKIGSIRN
jgi:cytidine deaminase